MKISHLNPDTLHKSPAFSQAVTVEAAGKLVFVGGQNGVDATGELVSEDFGAQTEQALKNVLAALAAAGATQENVVKLTIHVVQGNSIEQGFAASQKVWGMHPTAITVLMVAGLGADPRFLVEIDAVAAVAA